MSIQYTSDIIVISLVYCMDIILIPVFISGTVLISGPYIELYLEANFYISQIYVANIWKKTVLHKGFAVVDQRYRGFWNKHGVLSHAGRHCNHGKVGKESLAHCWHALILWSQLNAFALRWLSDPASKTWIWSTDWVVFAFRTPGLFAPVNTVVTRKC